jgi:4-azaleucine resistance transporter AzlC
MNPKPPEQPAPRWTFDAFRLGAWQMLPLLPGLAAFGMAFGTVAARKGFSLFDALLMTGTVYAGMSQMIVLESWPERLTWPAIAATVAVAALVNMRYLLIGATLRPWLAHEPSAKVYPTLFFLAEPNWLLSMRYRSTGASDPAFLLGSGVVMWVAWTLSAAPGYLIGSAVGDPQRFGLDLIMPAFFVAMLVPLWRGPRRSLGWWVGGAVAIAADLLFGGWWYLVAGALAGAIAGGLAGEPGGGRADA